MAVKENCRVMDLRTREVVNTRDGSRYGFVCDVDMELASGQVRALVVPGPSRLLGLFGRRDDIIIPWECVTKIGDDIILVDYDVSRSEKRD